MGKDKIFKRRIQEIRKKEYLIRLVRGSIPRGARLGRREADYERRQTLVVSCVRKFGIAVCDNPCTVAEEYLREIQEALRTTMEWILLPLMIYRAGIIILVLSLIWNYPAEAAEIIIFLFAYLLGWYFYFTV